MSIKFEKGQIYNTVKTLGVVRKEDGRLQISQRTGKDGPDIERSENLTFDSRDGGKLWFVREDGSRVCGHRSHFDAEDAYNATKEGGSGLEAARAKVAKKQAELEAAAALLETVIQEAETAASESDDTFVPVSDDARAEAEALFANEG